MKKALKKTTKKAPPKKDKKQSKVLKFNNFEEMISKKKKLPRVSLEAEISNINNFMSELNANMLYILKGISILTKALVKPEVNEGMETKPLNFGRNME